MNKPEMANVATKIGGSLLHWIAAGVIAFVIAVVVVLAYDLLTENKPVDCGKRMTLFVSNLNGLL